MIDEYAFADVDETSEIRIEGDQAARDIKRAGSRPSQKGPEDWFTGPVRIDPLFQTEAPARGAGAIVTFEDPAG